MNCISARETDKITDRLNCQLDQILGSHISHLRAGKDRSGLALVVCRLLSQVERREETLWLLL